MRGYPAIPHWGTRTHNLTRDVRNVYRRQNLNFLCTFGGNGSLLPVGGVRLTEVVAEVGFEPTAFGLWAR